MINKWTKPYSAIHPKKGAYHIDMLKSLVANTGTTIISTDQLYVKEAFASNLQ